MRPDAKARFITALVLWVVAFLVGIFGIFVKFLPVLQGQAQVGNVVDFGNGFFVASWIVLAGIGIWQLLVPPDR